MRKPADTTGHPSLEILYYDWYYATEHKPFLTVVLQKFGDGEFDRYQYRKLYNGLGQLIQSQNGMARLQDNACSPDADTALDICDVIVDYKYDTSGRLEKQTAPYAFAPWDWQSSPYHTSNFIDNPRNYTATGYDMFGRTKVVTATDGTTQTTTYGDGYDPINGYAYSLTCSTDAQGRQTCSRGDLFGRTRTVMPPTGPSVTYAYDEIDRLVNTMRGGVTTTLTYDMAGRKLTMNDPDMGNWSYAYDALGNLTRQTDARGCTTNLSYDLLSRPIGKNYGALLCGSGNTNVTYTYDNIANGNKGLGRRTGMADASGSTAWTYDARGRMTKEVKTISGAAYTTQYTYTLADQPQAMTYPDGEILTYGYNPQGMLDTLLSNKNLANQNSNYYLVTGTAYDAAGRVDYQYRGAANPGVQPVLMTDYTYNPWNIQSGSLQRISAGTYTTPTSLLDLRYTYDSVGNITNILDAGNSNQKQCYTYDALNRLTSAKVGLNDGSCSGSVGNGEYNDETYTYNSATGNLSNKAGVPYDYNDPAHKHAVTHLMGVQKYWYDANGNMIKRISGTDTFDFTYDAENRIYQVKKNNALLFTFTYDGDGKRVKSVQNATSAYTTIFVGAHYELSYPEVGETTVRKYYFAGGQRVAMRTNDQTGSTLRWLAADHLGSTSRVANADGAAYSWQLYKPWGETRYSQGGSPTQYTYTGQYSYADDFGLMYYNARWYDPALGRFAQADTVVPQASQGTQAWDRYAYVNNNPLSYKDSTGHAIGADGDDDRYSRSLAKKYQSNLMRAIYGGYASGLTPRYQSSTTATTSTPQPTPPGPTCGPDWVPGPWVMIGYNSPNPTKVGLFATTEMPGYIDPLADLPLGPIAIGGSGGLVATCSTLTGECIVEPSAEVNAGLGTSFGSAGLQFDGSLGVYGKVGEIQATLSYPQLVTLEAGSFGGGVEVVEGQKDVLIVANASVVNALGGAVDVGQFYYHTSANVDYYINASGIYKDVMMTAWHAEKMWNVAYLVVYIVQP